jgi:hypothetical protein
VRLRGRRSPDVDKSPRSRQGSQSWQASFLCWVSFEGENESLTTLSNRKGSFHRKLAHVSWSSTASPGQPRLVDMYIDNTFMHGKGALSNPSLIFVIPYRAIDTTLDVSSFPYGDAHGLLWWCRSEYPLLCLEPCREGFLLCIII